MEKFERYILIVILIVAIAILYFVYNNKKDTLSQSDLLLAMAKKMQVANVSEIVENSKSEKDNKIQDTQEETEEESKEIVRIAEKIYSGSGDLTKQEKEFQYRFSEEIQEEIEYCSQFYPLVQKFVSRQTEFTDLEKQFYENNSDAIEHELNKIKSAQSSHESITKDDEQKHPSVVLLNASASNIPEGGNPPLAQGERLKIILGFFEDGVPKTVTEISELYAQTTGTIASKGNMSTIFGKLEGKELLWEKIKHNSRWKIFYGLPEWFDGKKLKKEYKQKIQ